MNSKSKAWLVWGAVYLATCAVCLNQYKVIPVNTLLMEYYNMTKTTAGLLNSIFTIGGVVLAIPAAMILKRYGPKTTGMIAMGSSFVGILIEIISTNVTILMLGRVIEGIALGLIAVVAPAVISMWFSSEERGLPMGLWGTFSGVASFAIFNLAVPIVNSAGLKGVWWLGAILSGLGFAAWFFIVDAPEALKPLLAAAAKDNSTPITKHLFNWPSWIVAVIFFCYVFALYGFQSWAPTYLVEGLGLELSTANFYISLIALIGIPMAIVSGWTLDHVKNRKAILSTAMFLTIFIMFFAFRLPNTSFILPFVIATSLIIPFIGISIFTVLPDTMEDPAFAGLAIAIGMLGQNLSMFFGAPIVGSVAEKSGWQAATIPLAIPIVIGFVVTFFVKTFRGPAEPQKL